MNETGSRVVTVGEALISLEAQNGRLETAQHLEIHAVGAELNYAIDLARLGISTAFFGQVGCDPFGDRIVNQARYEGVEVSGVTRDADRTTGFLLKDLSLPNGERPTHYVRRGSAGSHFERTSQLDEALQTALGVHATGISFCVGPSLAAAARWLLSAQVPWKSFDINVRLKLAPPEWWAACLKEMLPMADTLFATEHELHAIGYCADFRCAARDGDTTLVIRGDRTPTRIYQTNGVVEEVAPIYLDAAVDPVGAGDAFAAAVTAWRLRGFSWQDAVRAGHWAGAMVARARGDFEAAPYLRELEALMARDSVVR